MSELPPGFVYEDELQAAPAGSPALPPGFEYETAAPAQAQPGGYKDSFLGRLSLIKPIQHAYEAAKSLGQEAMQGTLDPTSDSAIQRSFDVAGAVGPVSPAKMASQAGRSMLLGDPRNSIRRAQEGPTAAQIAAEAPMRERAAQLQAAENQGIPLPRAAMLPAYGQKVAAGISDLPIIGAPLQRARDTALTRAQERVGDVATGMGIPNAALAGEGIREGVQNFKSGTMRALDNDAYQPVRDMMPREPIFQPAESALALGQAMQRLQDSGGGLTGEAANIASLVRRGRVSFQGLQDARSRLGAEMADAFNSAGYNDGAARGLYGALSRDLDNFTLEHGGEATQSAWRAANEQAAGTRGMLETVKPFGNMANENATFESAFQLAMDRRGSAQRLGNLRAAVGPDAWRNVSATAIDRMGRNPGTNDFSPQVFVSSFEKMNATARNHLFGEAAPAVEELASAFRGLQSVERFRSKSQSANVTSVAGLTGGAFAGALTAPVTTAVGAATSFLAARQLAKPATVRQLAMITRTYGLLGNRPADGLFRQLGDQTRRLGVMLSRDGIEASEISPITGGLLDAGRSIMGRSQVMGTQNLPETQGDRPSL